MSQTTMTAQSIRRQPVLRRLTRNYELYLFALPAVVYFVLFCYAPMFGVQIAFKNFKPNLGIWGSPWVGLKHFQRITTLPSFLQIVRNTLALSLYQLAVGFPVPVVLALCINEMRSSKIRRTVQTVSYAPYFISTVVLVSLLEIFCNEHYGVLNALARAFRQETIPFLTRQQYFRGMYVLSGVWQGAGWSTIVYLSALTSIDPELHESAMIDGASRLQRVWHINMPCILPTLSLLFILQVGGLMSIGFEKVFLMQKDINIELSEVISTYVYKQGLQKLQYSFSAAVGLFNSVVNCLLLVLTNTVTRSLNGNSLF
ncbi:MAG: ABC transporter permease subunit [Oscillospiraceae bacterium]|jgi:putative aldouronate transport system permease protein|nr:ABC transporter permease subunit [Oscillospiraceae bacterium]